MKQERAPMKSLRKFTVATAILGATLGGGAAGMLLTGTANAQTDSSASSSTTAPSSAPATPSRPLRDPSQGGHTANGITEQVLTGDTAAQVTAAAQAAVSGATIERVET